MCASLSLSRVQLFAAPWGVAHRAPPPMGFSRQEYWSGLPFPSAGDLPDPGIEARAPALQQTLHPHLSREEMKRFAQRPQSRSAVRRGGEACSPAGPARPTASGSLPSATGVGAQDPGKGWQMQVWDAERERGTMFQSRVRSQGRVFRGEVCEWVRNPSGVYKVWGTWAVEGS